MKINEIISYLETIADTSLQEEYDNTGLIIGNADWDCTGIICTLDATEEVIKEAIQKKCNLIVAHHPIIFKGLKKINGKNYVEKTIIAAIKNDIAIYAIHTNLDNVKQGVNGRIAQMLGIQNCKILSEKEATLKKLFTFVPFDKTDEVRNAIFSAGAGHISNYSECSFNAEGIGTFKGGTGSNPYVGEPGKLHQEKEIKIEIIFPAYLERKIVTAMKEAHPYEEVAYDIVQLDNFNQSIGSGMVGELAQPVDENQFLENLKTIFRTPGVRHTRLLGKQIKRVAVCGGAGSFLISKALAANADAYITADIKYHEFFDANDQLLLADIGHYESEQFTINLLQEVLEQKFPTFAVLKTEVKTNPVFYHL
ncbi:MAG: Nif3-like dinuclear metal center hexameric protein [Chitinophagaceae bacterium]